MRTSVKVTNRRARPRYVCVEPWAGEWNVEAGETLEIVFESPSPVELEWEWLADDTDNLSVLAPTGTTLDVYRSGKRVPADR